MIFAQQFLSLPLSLSLSLLLPPSLLHPLPHLQPGKGWLSVLI